MVKKGFSFIELLVSIVIIGIVFMSIPLILSETGKSTELSIQQEAVMAGMTQLVNTMSYRWDENETNESLNGGYAKVLDTRNGATALRCIDMDGNRSRRRTGHFREAYRRRCYNPPRFASMLGTDGGDLDDIDDIVGTNKSLLTGGSGDTNSTIDYKKDYNVTLNVAYINDEIFNYSQTTPSGSISTISVGTDAADSTNIKMITATITSSSGSGPIVLRCFMANIGEYKIYHKSVK